jgi:prepilin-type N-terminal cleavage/methylation domain-containing protein
MNSHRSQCAPPGDFQAAFTLLELLVVIAILGILTSIIMPQLNSSRVEARDSVRVSDFQQFALGLNIFHSKYGVYPCGDKNKTPNTRDDSKDDTFLDGKGEAANPPNKCVGMPDTGLHTDGLTFTRNLQDPLNDNEHYYYYLVSADRQNYVLVERLENGAGLMANDGGLCDNYYELGPGAGDVALDPGTLFGIPCN